LIEGGKCSVNRAPKVVEKTRNAFANRSPIGCRQVPVPDDAEPNGWCRARQLSLVRHDLA
jgi:hypothetical protein